MIQDKINQLTQMGSPYIGSSAGVEEMIRVNNVAEAWPDAVLEGVIGRGPRSAAHIQVFAEVLRERKEHRAAIASQTYRKETTAALADLANIQTRAEDAAGRRFADISRKLDELKKPHWSVAPNFWVTVISALAAVIAAIIALLMIFGKSNGTH
jgi:hypothetical protein